MLIPKTFVLDACAILAFLRQEAGAEAVEDLLTDPNVQCIVHVINLCEVYYDFIRSHGIADARRIVDYIASLGIMVRDDMDLTFWQNVGELKVNPGRISLADCFVLALTLRSGATLVTTDHEFDAIADLGIAPILFIR